MITTPGTIRPLDPMEIRPLDCETSAECRGRSSSSNRSRVVTAASLGLLEDSIAQNASW